MEREGGEGGKGRERQREEEKEQWSEEKREKEKETGGGGGEEWRETEKGEREYVWVTPNFHPPTHSSVLVQNWNVYPLTRGCLRTHWLSFQSRYTHNEAMYISTKDPEEAKFIRKRNRIHLQKSIHFCNRALWGDLFMRISANRRIVLEPLHSSVPASFATISKPLSLTCIHLWRQNRCCFLDWGSSSLPIVFVCIHACTCVCARVHVFICMFAFVCRCVGVHIVGERDRRLELEIETVSVRVRACVRMWVSQEHSCDSGRHTLKVIHGCTTCVRLH